MSLYTWDHVKLIREHPHVLGHLVGKTLLTDIHSEWIHYIWSKHRERALMAHRGSYKCQSPDTMIMMGDYSSRRLGDIEIGDYVMGWDGTPRKVLNKYSGNSPMYRVTLNKNGEYYECNNNHILTMRQRPVKHNKFHCVDKYRYDKDPLIINIPIEDFLNSGLSKPKGKNSKETFFKHFKVGLNNIPERKVVIPPYILGVWLGDGHSDRVGITCADNETEVLKEFKEWCLKFNPKDYIYKKDGAKCASYVYSSDAIRNLFKKYNLLRTKKYIPDDYLFNSRENRLQLLAGLLDTDGYYGVGHYTFCTKHEDFAKRVEWLARSLGFNAKAKPFNTFCTYKGEKQESIAWQVYINGNICEIPVRLKRKQAKTKKTKICHLSFSQTIEPIGDGEFVGIEIEGDGMFLMDNFLVVHNTTAIGEIGPIQWLLFNPNDRVFIIRKTFTDAMNVVQTIVSMMETPEIADLFHFVHGTFPFASKNSYTRRKELISFSFKKTLTPEGSLNPRGLDTGLTGSHGDFFLLDDFVTLDDRISNAKRENTKSIVREIATNIVDPGKPVRYIGTPWHKKDAWSICPKPLKFSIYDIDLLSKEEIEEKKKKTTPSLFAANYELNHVADDDALFKDPVWGDWKTTGIEAPRAHLDAAFDGDHYCALTIMARRHDGKVQAKGFTYPGNIKTWINEGTVTSIMRRHNCKIVYNEENPDKGFVADLLKDEGFIVKRYTETTKKSVKISTYLYEMWRDLIWSEDTDGEYMNQILDWREGQEPDDAPDSASSLVKFCYTKRGMNRRERWSW